MAAAYIKDGMEPRQALRIAANSFGFSVSEVASASGHRGGLAAGKQKRSSRREREEAEAFDFIKRS